MMAARIRSRRILLDSDSSTYLSPDDGLIGRTGASYTNEVNLDTNMVIILAALLCALICALGINSILRCALRCGRRIVTGEANSPLSATGLKKSALRRIPVAVYKGSEITIPATECPICLGEFVDGEKVRVLPRCNHGFHVKCIDTWLAAHSSCPTCRGSLVDCSAGSSAGSAGQLVELPVNAGQRAG